MAARAIIVVVGDDHFQDRYLLRDVRAAGTDGLTYQSTVVNGGDLPTALHCQDGSTATAIDAFLAEQDDPASDLCLSVATYENDDGSHTVLDAEIVCDPEFAAEFEGSWAKLQGILRKEAQPA